MVFYHCLISTVLIYIDISFIYIFLFVFLYGFVHICPFWNWNVKYFSYSVELFIQSGQSNSFMWQIFSSIVSLVLILCFDIQLFLHLYVIKYYQSFPLIFHCFQL